jgi:hypothetical protein
MVYLIASTAIAKSILGEGRISHKEHRENKEAGPNNQRPTSSVL